jgi:hypothetical protein
MQPRKGISLIALDLPKGEIVTNLSTYRIKNVWWKRPFIGKYRTRLYAMTASGVYDITDVAEAGIKK